MIEAKKIIEVENKYPKLYEFITLNVTRGHPFSSDYNRELFVEHLEMLEKEHGTLKEANKDLLKWTRGERKPKAKKILKRK